jgi:enterochelin esterase-like enzyme
MRKPARFFFCLLTLSLAACAAPAAALESAVEGPPYTATALPPSVTPAPTATPLPVPTRTPQVAVPTAPVAPDCTETHGNVTNHNYHAFTLGYSLFYDVYLPPCYDSSGDYYPVLYLLHGQAFIEDQWDRLGADEAADELIDSGQVAPFIMIMPRGGANPYFGDGLIKDLMPHVETEYRILRDRDHRAIGGLSRGGGWAIFLGLKYPNLFSIIGGHSPAIQYIHAPEIDNLLDDLPANEIPRIWLDIGDNDSLISNTEWFMALLDERSLPYTFHTFPGRHEEAYWSSHVQEYLLFYAGSW